MEEGVMFGEGKSGNLLAKWASVVFPRVFGIEIITKEVIKELLKKSDNK
jgi:hypothetical protein